LLSALVLTEVVDVLPFVPLPVIEELLVLDPLSEYPNIYNVGGTEWKRATEIASDIFKRCPGRAFIRNMTEYAPTWRCVFSMTPKNVAIKLCGRVC
jgi:hypothetical protein